MALSRLIHLVLTGALLVQAGSALAADDFAGTFATPGTHATGTVRLWTGVRYDATADLTGGRGYAATRSRAGVQAWVAPWLAVHADYVYVHAALDDPGLDTYWISGDPRFSAAMEYPAAKAWRVTALSSLRRNTSASVAGLGALAADRGDERRAWSFGQELRAWRAVNDFWVGAGGRFLQASYVGAFPRQIDGVRAVWEADAANLWAGMVSGLYRAKTWQALAELEGSNLSDIVFRATGEYAPLAWTSVYLRADVHALRPSGADLLEAYPRPPLALYAGVAITLTSGGWVGTAGEWMHRMAAAEPEPVLEPVQEIPAEPVAELPPLEPPVAAPAPVTEGTVVGWVFDEQGGSVTGYVVDTEQVERRVELDADGYFGLRLPEGTYRLLAAGDGYEPAVTEVTVYAAAETAMTFTLRKIVTEPEAVVTYSEESKEIVIKDVIRFELDSTRLDEASYPTLNRLADTLRATPGIRLQIDGHTDDTGSEKYNQELSEGRAANVAQYLRGLGIEAERVLTRGYGFTVPLCSETTEECRERNRRVDFKVIE